MFFKIGVRAVDKLFFSWPVFVRLSSKPLGHVESMLKINWDLRECSGRGLGQSFLKLQSFYWIYSDNMNKKKKKFKNSEVFNIYFE